MSVTSKRLSVTPYPTMGAEVRGVDLRRVDADAFDVLLDAWWRYAVLVFPAQHLTEAEQVAFSRRLGRLERIVARQNLLSADPARPALSDQIGRLSNAARNGRPVPQGSSLWLFLSGNQRWHSDSSFKVVPAKASLLSAWTVPSRGGETEWADMRQAYDALDEDTRRFWADKVAVHSYWYSQSIVGGTDVLSAADWAALPPVEHPVVRANPDSGRRSLFVGRHASHVVGMAEAEGRRLLGELTESACQPRWTLRHRWQVGDAVLWDNRSVLHRGRPWPSEEVRIMKRTTIAGDGDHEWVL